MVVVPQLFSWLVLEVDAFIENSTNLAFFDPLVYLSIAFVKPGVEGF